MQKNYQIYREYLETLKNNRYFFGNYYYHAVIDFNLIKLDSILKNGILPKNAIEQNHLPNIYTHSSFSNYSKNGSKYISLTKYDDRELYQYFDSFALHTLTSISLLIDKGITINNEGERETNFRDEIFSERIYPSSIKGILVPSHIINSKINELPSLCNEMGCYTKLYLNNLICVIETYFDSTIDKQKIYKSLEKFWSIARKYKDPQKCISSILEIQQASFGMDLQDIISSEIAKKWMDLLNVSSATSLDIIKYLNANNLPIYELSQKTLKKV